MIGLLFLVSVLYNGKLIHNFFLDKQTMVSRFASDFILGSIASVTFCFLLLQLFQDLGTALIIYGVVFSLIFATTFNKLIKNYQETYGLLMLFVTGCMFLLFEKSFSYDSVKDTFLIQSNLYQDMGAHIPIVRYFSSGHTYPEVPFYAGGNLFYHFMFDFYTSILEFLGVRIDIAFNLLSAFALTSLCAIVISLSTQIFKSKLVGIIAAIFLILSFDLSFLDIFKSGLSISSIYHHNVYPEINFFGIVINQYFLNINTLLNQRQLIFALSWIFYCFYLLLSNASNAKDNKLNILLVLLIGLSPFWNVPVLISFYIVLMASFVVFKNLRKRIIMITFFSALIVIPQLLLIKLNSHNQIIFHPGFILRNISLRDFVLFWTFNLGLCIPIVAFSLIKSSARQRKVFFVFIPLFIIANLFQFSADPFDNHKFFNVWFVVVCLFTSYGIIMLFRSKILPRLIVILLVFFLVFSGILHLLVVKNDINVVIPDSKNLALDRWIETHAKRDAVFLTNGDIYDPLTLNGRRVFLGRAQYVFLYGGDPSERLAEQMRVLSGSKLAKQVYLNGVDYIVIYKDKSVANLKKTNVNYLNRHYLIIYEDNFGTIYKI